MTDWAKAFMSVLREGKLPSGSLLDSNPIQQTIDAQSGKGSAIKNGFKLLLKIIATIIGFLIFTVAVTAIAEKLFGQSAGQAVTKIIASLVIIAPLSILLWLVQKRMSWKAKVASGLAISLMIFAVISSIRDDDKASSLGFTSATAMHEAEKAGFHDNASWSKHLADLAAQEKGAAFAAAKREQAEQDAEADRERQDAAAEKAKLKAILTDAKALDDKYDGSANAHCGAGADNYLRSIAVHDFAWDDEAKGFLAVKFGSYLTHVSEPGVLTMVSDYAKLQNGFGAYTHIKLFCRYDTQSEAVLGYESTQ